MSTFSTVTSIAAVDNFLSEQANNIDKDVHRYIVHTSPWIDLVPRGTFEDGEGYLRNTLVFDRTLPQYESTPGSGTFDRLGVNFVDVAASSIGATDRGAGVLDEAHASVQGPAYNAARINFTKKLREYNLQSAAYFGPYMDLDSLRFTTNLVAQVSSMVEQLGDATRNTIENRHRDEYDRVADNVVACKTSGTVVTTGLSGTATGGSSATGTLDMDANSAALLPTANLSNYVTDMVQMRLRRGGFNRNAWGMENGKAVHLLILSSEADRRLKLEAGYRDDLRNNSSRVDELLQPLGVDSSWRGFYHITDDLAPRYNFVDDGTDDYLARVYPEVFSSGVLIPNTAYDTATYEAAYVVHKDVMESQIPNPNLAAGGGVSFMAQNYTGEFSWHNNKTDDQNPFGTRGRFAGRFATATKVIKPDAGYRILFDRTSTAYAA